MTIPDVTPWSHSPGFIPIVGALSIFSAHFLTTGSSKFTIVATASTVVSIGTCYSGIINHSLKVPRINKT